MTCAALEKSRSVCAVPPSKCIPGMSAEDYIRDSILHPSNFVVPGFPDAMVKDFGTILTADQINDLIAFLMTLK